MEKLPPTHRAISLSSASSEQSKATLAESEARFLEARSCWLRLYSEPDCLTDPEKRLAMLSVRLQYQEAELDWHFHLRSAGGLGKLYADVLTSVRDGFLSLEIADVADVHHKLNVGSSPNGLVAWAIAQHLRERLNAGITEAVAP